MANSESPGRQPLPPATRRRLQQQFEHGSKMSATGNYDYATDLFTNCVVGDPANLIYLQNFLGNLYKKYNNNKKGSKLAGIKGAARKASIRKVSMQKDWPGVLREGLEMLKLNPWDTGTLVAMADACEKLDYEECQLAYLRGALDADLKDPEINRIAGRALARQGLFDDAIACWHRVQKALPKDVEAQRAIGDLTVEKTIKKGGYESSEQSKDMRAEQDEEPEIGLRLTPEKQLEKAIAKNPTDQTNYVRLADLHIGKERFDEAEEVLKRALEVSGGDLNLRERLEDTQLRRQREQLSVAEKQFLAERNEQNEKLYRKLRAELNQQELEIYLRRTERYPTNLGYKYEVGMRLKRGGKPKEAIPYFQQAQQDTQRKGEVLLMLGECFQQLKPVQTTNLKLAMRNYADAVENIFENNQEMRKLALFRAGSLAMALRDLDAAENYLTTLAGIAFTYKDVSTLLDKLNDLRKDQ